MISALTDEELVAKYREAGGHPHGTPFADQLFSRHYARVALWCLRIAGDRDAAADLAQEVFSKAWLHLDHFRGDSRFTTWLYTIARNHCFNAAKKRGRNAEDAVDSERLDLFGSSEAGVQSALEQSELLETARAMMARELSPVEAQVMTLHFSEELPLDAISRLLKMENASGAKAYMVSARRKLKAAVERWKVRHGRQ